METPTSSRLFKSYWIAGYESSCHRNRAGRRLDLLAATQHDLHAAEDYRLLAPLRIGTVRDTVRWHLVDREGTLDFSSLAPMVEAARAEDVQVIWDLCHYGWPDDLEFFSSAFVGRFASYAAGVAEYFSRLTPGPRFYVPINEISFMTYAICERGDMYPFAIGRSGDVKRQLVLATLAASDAIRGVDPTARLVHVDPLFYTVPPRDQPELERLAAENFECQFESADMLRGRLFPELGGAERYLDLVGVSYYFGNQWEYPGFNRLRWEDRPRDDRWLPLSRLLERAIERYNRPLLIAETSHFGVGRAEWLREITDEVVLARERGVSLEGICIYPILDRPDYDDPHHWHHSGLFDRTLGPNGRFCWSANPEYVAELRRSQALLS